MKLHHLVFALSACLLPACVNAMREKQALEAFELSSLKLEAVYLLEDCAPFASVRDAGGYLHRAFKGDYVGKNFGRIVELSEQGIRLMEAFEIQNGEWQARQTWLLKAQEESGK